MIKLTVYKNGTKMWFWKGIRHRANGPAIAYLDGVEDWFWNGHLHRDGGPAIKGPGLTIGWYQHGKLHNTTGPARIKEDGKTEYYINDNPLSEYEFMFVTGETV